MLVSLVYGRGCFSKMSLNISRKRKSFHSVCHLTKPLHFTGKEIFFKEKAYFSNHLLYKVWPGFSCELFIPLNHSLSLSFYFYLFTFLTGSLWWPKLSLNSKSCFLSADMTRPHSAENPTLEDKQHLVVFFNPPPHWPSHHLQSQFSCLTSLLESKSKH